MKLPDYLDTCRRIRGLTRVFRFPFRMLRLWAGSAARGGGADTLRRTGHFARQVLEKVGMWEYRDRPIGKLSGGQRQRVLIARALCAEPKILLMDEPTASVDSQFQTDLYDFLKELNATITIVVVSHDMSVLSGYINSVACLNQTLFYHDAGEITDEMLHSAYHCPVDLIAHGGVPHRVLRKHDHEDP